MEHHDFNRSEFSKLILSHQELWLKICSNHANQSYLMWDHFKDWFNKLTGCQVKVWSVRGNIKFSVTAPSIVQFKLTWL